MRDLCVRIYGRFESWGIMAVVIDFSSFIFFDFSDFSDFFHFVVMVLWGSCLMLMRCRSFLWDLISKAQVHDTFSRLYARDLRPGG